MSAFVSGFSSATKLVSALEHATKWNKFDGDEVASTFIVPVFQYGPDIQCVRAHLPRDHNLTLRENEFFVEFDVQEAALFSEIGCLVETNFYRVSRCSTRERKYWNGLFLSFLSVCRMWWETSLTPTEGKYVSRDGSFLLARKCEVLFEAGWRTSRFLNDCRDNKICSWYLEPVAST